MDISEILKNKKEILKYTIKTIESSERNANGLRSMRERGFSESGMIDKLIEVTAIQSEQIKSMATIIVVLTQSEKFDSMVAEMMTKLGRSEKALNIMFNNKMSGK